MDHATQGIVADQSSQMGRLATDGRYRVAWASAVILFVAIAALALGLLASGAVTENLLKFAVINIIAAVGLGLFCGSTGILSLGHVVFFGVAAYVSAWFTIPPTIKSFLLPDMPAFIRAAEWPLWQALVPALLAVLVVGAVTGLVMRRMRDTSAVIASFGFLAIAYLLFIGLKELTNGKQSLYAIPSNQVSWGLLLGALAVALGVAFAVKGSRLGRKTEALRDNEAAARSIGIIPENAIFGMWVTSALIVGLAGALFTHTVGIAAPSAFYLDKTFALIVIIIIGGYRSLTGAVLGAIAVTFAEEVFKKAEESLNAIAGQPIAFGIEMPEVFGLTALAFSVMILLVLYYRPDGIAGYREIADIGALRSRLRRTKGDVFDGRAAHRVDPTAVLRTEAMEKRYGPFRALSPISMEVNAGHITGLIGPNGAGKSTLINTITGALFASGGRIVLNGQDATLWSASKLARGGVGRTFQNIRVFPSLTVLENVICAVNISRPELGAREAETQAMRWLRSLGLTEAAHNDAGALAYGDQRRLEIARALALEPSFLLLDEPAAGMNHSETEALSHLLRHIVEDMGCGILLVEHDLPMVMSICDRIYVVNKGEQIAEGTPEEVRANPDVIEAYIGEELADH